MSCKRDVRCPSLTEAAVCQPESQKSVSLLHQPSRMRMAARNREALNLSTGTDGGRSIHSLGGRSSHCATAFLSSSSIFVAAYREDYALGADDHTATENCWAQLRRKHGQGVYFCVSVITPGTNLNNLVAISLSPHVEPNSTSHTIQPHSCSNDYFFRDRFFITIAWSIEKWFDSEVMSLAYFKGPILFSYKRRIQIISTTLIKKIW